MRMRQGAVMKKIVITGMGAVTPIGIGVDNYWENITAGVSGIDTIKSFDASELAVQIAGEVKNFNPSDYMPKDVYKRQALHCPVRSLIL